MREKPDCLRADIFGSAAICFRDSDNRRKKAILRYLLSFGKRNANLTLEERQVFTLSEPFVMEFDTNRYWRNAVSSSTLYKAIIRKLIKYPLISYFRINPIVLVQGEGIIFAQEKLGFQRPDLIKRGTLADLLKIKKDGENEFLKTRSEGPICYCFEDSDSNTEILLLGSWMESRFVPFVPEPTDYSDLSGRGFLPDYTRLVDLMVNLLSGDIDKFPLDDIFKEINPRSAAPLPSIDLKKFKGMPQPSSYPGTICEILEKDRQNIGESADLYRLLILQMVKSFPSGDPVNDRITWSLVEFAVMPYLQLKLLCEEDWQKFSELRDSLSGLIGGRSNQTERWRHLIELGLNEFLWFWLQEDVTTESLLRSEDKALKGNIDRCLVDIKAHLHELVFKQWVMAYERMIEIKLLNIDLYESVDQKPKESMFRELFTADPDSTKFKTVYNLYPYAMNAVFHVISALVNSTDGGCDIYYLNSIYFEVIQQQIKQFRFSKKVELHAVTQLSEIKHFPAKKQCILIADMHTNNADFEFRRPNDVCTWVLQLKKPGQPLADVHLDLVLDLTLNNPTEALVRDWVAQLSEHQGLNVYIIMSLTKLMQMGVDFLSMGLCFAFGSDVIKLTSPLKEPRRKEVMFGFLAKRDFGQLREQFFSKIHENVNYIYESLKASLLPEQKKGKVRVGFTQDDRTVYVSLNLHESLKSKKTLEEIHEKLLHYGRQLRIQLSGRNSFGFSFSGINITKSALRLTAGIEPRTAVNRLVEFLTTFFNLLSCDLVDNDRFYQNFSKAVSAVSFNEKISKDTQILDEDVSPVKRNLRVFADGLEIEGFCNRIRFSRLWRYGLLHKAYRVNAIPVLKFHRDFSGDLYFEESEYGFGEKFLFKDPENQIEQTEGQNIIIRTSDSGTVLLGWSLGGKKLHSSHIYIDAEPDILPVAFQRLTQDQKNDIFKRIFTHQIQLNKRGDEDSYDLVFPAARASLYTRLEEAKESYEFFKSFLEASWGSDPYMGLRSEVHSLEFHNCLFKTAVALIRDSHHNEQELQFLHRSSQSQEPYRVLLVAHMCYRLRQVKDFDELLVAIDAMIDKQYVEPLNEGDFLSDQLIKKYQGKVLGYAGNLSIEILSRIGMIRHDLLKAKAYHALYEFIMMRICKPEHDFPEDDFDLEAFKQLPMDDIYDFIHRLGSLKEPPLHHSYQEMVEYWLIKCVSLNQLIDLQDPEFSLVWQIKSYLKENPNSLCRYWEFATGAFNQLVTEAPHLYKKSGLLNQCIFWFFTIQDVWMQGQGAELFKETICRTLRTRIGQFTKLELEECIEKFRVYHESESDEESSFVLIRRSQKNVLCEFFGKIGLGDFLEREYDPRNNHHRRLRVYCGYESEPERDLDFSDFEFSDEDNESSPKGP
jgi:hypothetical protein